MPRLDCKPFPVLNTTRLTLRQLDLRDTAEIYALRSDDRVNQFLDRPKTETMEEARLFIQKINDGIERNEWLYWAIVFQKQTALIGTICLWNFSSEKNSAEIGYELNPDFHGQGIMQEAMVKVIDYAFRELELQELEAHTHALNSKSTAILTRNNFKRELNSAADARPVESDLVIYTLRKPG